MGRARDISKVFSTNTALATDSEISAFNYLTQASASTVYQTKAAAGLTLLNYESFSGVGSKSFSNFTSSTYNDYRVLMNIKGSTAASLFFRFRENVTDKATSYYGAAGQARYQGTFALYTNVNNDTQMNIGDLDPNNFAAYSFDFHKFEAGKASIIGQSWERNNIATLFYGLDNVSMSNVTGFTITASSGTITSGTVSIYGYNK